jgi:hypothetical protein
MPAAKINLDAGGNQVGRAGRPLADPLSVVVTDEGHNRLEGVRVDFSVVEGGGHFNGSRQLSVQTDSDGRALALLTLGNGDGIDNNRVEATFPGCPGLPAVFVATGRIPADPADTRISGTVLDHTDTPILGVTIRVDGTELQTTSDEQGQFVLQNATVGPVHLVADGSTARRSGDWPSLSYEMVSVAGQNNTLGMPIYLLPLDTPNGIRVGPETGGVLSLPDIPGFALDIAAGSATFLDGSDRGLVSVTAVHADKIPMEPNFGQQPRFVVTIQPAGVLFDPPAKLTLPNTDGLAPGEVTDLYSFDHDLGQFVSIGTGTVSADGTVIASDPGGGVAKGGWHCGGNPQTTGGAEKVHVRVDDCAPDCGGTDIKILRLEPGENGAIVATGGPDPGTYTWRVTDSEALTLSGAGDSAQLTKNTAGPSKVTVRYTCRSGAWAEEDVLVLSEGDQYVGLDPNQHCEIDESGDQSIVVFHQNKILNLEAHAVPANGTYSWKVIDERPDPGFDTLIVGLGPVLVPGNTPSCTNRPDCGAVFDTRHPGRAKVEVTFTPADGSPAVTASREIIVLKLEVEKMWSDQIPNVGAVSNFLPGGAGKQGNCDASCYILMGTRADGGLYAQASLRATPDILSKISRKLIVRLAALPDDGGTNLLVTGNANRAKGFDTQAISAGTLPQTIVQVTGGVGYPVGRGGLRGENAVLVFDNPGFVASTDYTIAAGLDINKDGILNKDEIIQGRVDFFREAGKQTPLFKVITKGSYLTQVTLAEGGQFFSSVGLTIAPTVLDAFLDDNDPGSGRLFGTDSGLISFDETIPGGASSPLDHNVGVIYNSSGQGTIRFHQWTVGSEVSNTILQSATFNSALKLYLLRKSQTVRDFFIANPGATSNTFTWNDFSISQSWNSNDEKDLFFAFGASTTTATLSATVRASDLELTSLGIGGKTVDLYDWNYEKPVSIAGAEIVRLVAIQAGYNTLGKGGHIFRIQVDLTETRNAGAVLYDHIRDEDGDVDEVVTTSFDFK